MKKTKKLVAFIFSSMLVLSFVGCSRTVTGNKDSR